MKKIAVLLSLCALVFFLTGFTHAITGLNPGASLASVVGLVLLSSVALSGGQMKGSLFMAATTDIDAIVKWAGKFDQAIISQMLNGLDVVRDLKTDRNVSRHGKLLPKYTAKKGMRPLDTDVEQNGGTERTLSGRKLYVKDSMKLFKWVPEEWRETFLSDMLEPGAVVVPFASYFWDQEMKKLASEINDNFYLQEFHADAADYSAATVYNPDDYIKFTDSSFYKCITLTVAGESPTTTPAKWEEVNHLVSFDGPAKIIADEITATNITPIVTGSITAANALTKVELMYKAMTVPHQNKGGKVRMSPDVFQKYLDHEKTIYPNVLDQNMGDGKKYVYGTSKKWEIVQCTWMGTSQRIIFDMEGTNLRVGTNLKDNPGITKNIPTLHGYLSVAKWLFGFEIADLEVLYVNDQA